MREIHVFPQSLSSSSGLGINLGLGIFQSFARLLFTIIITIRY